MIVTTSRRVDQATEALAKAIAALDLGAATPVTCKELVALGERIERTGRTVKSLAAAKVAESAVWRGDGDRTPEDWLARTTGTTRAEAAKELECGRHLQLVPEVAQAATAGELSVKQTEAIAGAAAVDPAAAGRLLEQRQGQGPARAAGRVPGHPHQRRPRSRGHPGPDPRQAVVPHLDRPRRHRPPPPVRPQRRHRPARQRRAPPLRPPLPRAPAATVAASPPTPTPSTPPTELLTSGGDSTPVPAGADAKIIVRVDLPALLRGRAVDERDLRDRRARPDPRVGRAGRGWTNAFLAAIVTKGTEITKVVHLGRRFTSEQRTALQWRDPICARKGCDNRLGLEYDHFEDWADTHTTRVDAGRRFCPPCHRLKTLGWTVSDPDADGQCTFTPPVDPARAGTTTSSAPGR